MLLLPNFLAACFAVLTIAVHDSGHIDSGLEVCGLVWWTSLEILESCETDPIFQDSFMSLDVPLTVNPALHQIVQLKWHVQLVVREVRRDGGKCNHLKCFQSRPCPPSLRVRQFDAFSAAYHLH